MKIGILGNGAIGNLLALKCHKLHQPFSLLTRDRKPFLLSATDINRQQFTIPIHSADVSQVKLFDLVILPVKAYQVIPALLQMADTLTPRQTLVLVHNGMGVLDEAQALLPHIPLIAATTSHAAYKPDMTQVHETGIGTTHCGYVKQPEIAGSHAIVSLLDDLLAPCTWHPDINAPLWHKLAINAVINPLTALHQIKNGQLAQPAYKVIIADLCAETAKVMQTSGYPVTPIDLIKTVNQVIKSSANNYSSMFQDILHARKTEINFINGYLVRQGQKLGIHTPNHSRLQNAILQREAHYRSGS